MDKEERINQITKQVKILERVPRDRMRLIHIHGKLTSNKMVL